MRGNVLKKQVWHESARLMDVVMDLSLAFANKPEQGQGQPE